MLASWYVISRKYDLLHQRLPPGYKVETPSKNKVKANLVKLVFEKLVLTTKSTMEVQRLYKTEKRENINYQHLIWISLENANVVPAIFLKMNNAILYFIIT